MERVIGNTMGGDELDPAAPQREAAIFYGLFLRGHSADTLRKDIDIPRKLLDKWMRAPHYEDDFRDRLNRIYHYRKQVLAIFDALLHHEKRNRPRPQ